jgi:hypothetical protein
MEIFIASMPLLRSAYLLLCVLFSIKMPPLRGSITYLVYLIIHSMLKRIMINRSLNFLKIPLIPTKIKNDFIEFF